MGTRVIKASPDAMAALEIKEASSRIAGNNENFFYADESGCYISGHISIRTDPEQIRIATGYTFLPAYQAQLPSTVVNPTPTLIANSPVEGFSAFADAVSDLLGELL